MQAEPSKTDKQETLLRLPQVEARVGLRKSSIYDAVRRGEFPAPLRLSRRAVCWPESSIDAWIASRIAAGSKKVVG